MKEEELNFKIKELKDFGFTGEGIEFKSLLISCSTQEDWEGTPHYFVFEEGDESVDGVFQSIKSEEIVEFVFNY